MQVISAVAEFEHALLLVADTFRARKSQRCRETLGRPAVLNEEQHQIILNALTLALTSALLPGN